MLDRREFQSRMQQIDQLLHDAEENADPAMRSALQELAGGLLELHGQALGRLLEIFANAGVAGAEVLARCGSDELVGSLLILHGLHPLDLRARIDAALKKVQPYLSSHGGCVEVVSISPDGAVHLRLEGSCHGCPSSRVTLETRIEEEIYAAAPDVTSIAVEGLVEPEPVPPAGFVPVEAMAINGHAVHAAAS